MIRRGVLFGASVAVLMAGAKEAAALDASPADAALQTARSLVRGDKYLQITEDLQCREPGPDGKAVVGGGPIKYIEPTKIFDNLYFIGTTNTGAMIITTSAGYIMIDAMYGTSPEKTLIPSMHKLGLDPSKVKYILITHAGPDHAGGTKYFQEHYGTKIVMSAEDWGQLLNPAPGSWVLNSGPRADLPLQEREWSGPPTKDMVGIDGQKLTLGDTTVTFVSAPRRVNGGGLSFIAPVTDHGQPHMWATFGNTNFPGSAADRQVHRDSVRHFLTAMEAARVDVLISSHPFVDGSSLRMEELRQHQPGRPNPFVIGEDAAWRYMTIIGQCTAVQMARAEAGLDESGRPKGAESSTAGSSGRPNGNR